MAVQYLEANNKMTADAVTNSFGGGKLHHLLDFSRHPTPIGLLFSTITQFTGAVYGTDLTGSFQVVPLPDPDSALIGSTFPEKIILWIILILAAVYFVALFLQEKNLLGFPIPDIRQLREMLRI